MKSRHIVKRIFKDFPGLLIANILLFLLANLTEAMALVSLVTVIDLFLNPGLRGASSITRHIADALISIGIPGTFGWFLSIFMLLNVIKTLLQILSQYQILKTKYIVLRKVYTGAFEDFFNAGWYFFTSGKQGTLLNTFTREINTVGDAFGAIARYFSNLLQIILFLIIPFFISWQVTFMVMGIALILSIPFMLLGKISYRLGAINTSTGNEMGRVISEGLSAAKIILGFGNQNKIFKSMENSYDTHCDVSVKSQTLSLSLPLLHYPFGLLVLVIGLFLAKRFNLPLSETIVLFYSLSRVIPLMGAIIEQKTRLDNYLPSFEQVDNLRGHAKELRQPSGIKKFAGFKDKVIVEKLTFAYPNHEAVLRSINMVFPKGKMIAVVGESGSGKSTFIDMLMRFYEPVSGRILFDGTDLSEFEITSFRHHIGYVPQDIVLFNATVKDNLLWANKHAGDADIENACRQANADEFIRKLPNGFNTFVGDRGVRLSGGQAQRVALARAIIRRPELLILDEATSSLDTYSERLIQSAIENIAKETTVIAIAHRLSTIINADYIYVLKNGRIEEEGDYLELIQKNGNFKRMVQLQNLELNSSSLKK